MTTKKQDDVMLSPGEVARRFGVDPKTVIRWADSGQIEHIRTPGGHRRFPAAAVEKLLKNNNR